MSNTPTNAMPRLRAYRPLHQGLLLPWPAMMLAGPPGCTRAARRCAQLLAVRHGAPPPVAWVSHCLTYNAAHQRRAHTTRPRPQRVPAGEARAGVPWQNLRTPAVPVRPQPPTHRWATTYRRPTHLPCPASYARYLVSRHEGELPPPPVRARGGPASRGDACLYLIWRAPR